MIFKIMILNKLKHLEMDIIIMLIVLEYLMIIINFYQEVLIIQLNYGI